MAENKWYPAVEALSKLRPRMAPFGKEMATEIDFDLALCYERLGRYEQAKQFYDLIVQQNPQNAPAVAGAQRVAAYSASRQGKQDPVADPLQAKMAEIQKLPKDKQDWSDIEKAIDELAEKNKLTPLVVTALESASRHDARRLRRRGEDRARRRKGRSRRICKSNASRFNWPA